LLCLIIDKKEFGYMSYLLEKWYLFLRIKMLYKVCILQKIWRKTKEKV